MKRSIKSLMLIAILISGQSSHAMFNAFRAAASKVTAKKVAVGVGYALPACSVAGILGSVYLVRESEKKQDPFEIYYNASPCVKSMVDKIAQDMNMLPPKYVLKKHTFNHLYASSTTDAVILSDGLDALACTNEESGWRERCSIEQDRERIGFTNIGDAQEEIDGVSCIIGHELSHIKNQDHEDTFAFVTGSFISAAGSLALVKSMISSVLRAPLKKNLTTWPRIASFVGLRGLGCIPTIPLALAIFDYRCRGVEFRCDYESVMDRDISIEEKIALAKGGIRGFQEVKCQQRHYSSDTTDSDMIQFFKDVFSSHPSCDERIAQLEKIIEDLERQKDEQGSAAE